MGCATGHSLRLVWGIVYYVPTHSYVTGMMHGCPIKKDGSVSYCNRYVVSYRLTEERAAGKPLFLKVGLWAIYCTSCRIATSFGTIILGKSLSATLRLCIVESNCSSYVEGTTLDQAHQSQGEKKETYLADPSGRRCAICIKSGCPHVLKRVAP